MSAQRAFLLDASAIFFKYYFAMPDHWHSRCGQSTAAVYGYTHWLKRFIQDQEPQRMVACFDESLGTCFRNQLYPAYKSNRPVADENIKFQFQACKKITELFGVPTYASTLYEADDLIGSLLSRYKKQNCVCTILSRDKDLGQLLGHGDCLWDYPNDPPIGATEIHEKFGVPCNALPDYLALCGDPIDNIPGVPGVGAKTAVQLLNHFSSVEHLLACVDQVTGLPVRGANTLSRKLKDYADQILMAKRLATIETNSVFCERVRLKKIQTKDKQLSSYSDELGFKLALSA